MTYWPDPPDLSDGDPGGAPPGRRGRGGRARAAGTRPLWAAPAPDAGPRDPAGSPEPPQWHDPAAEQWPGQEDDAGGGQDDHRLPARPGRRRRRLLWPALLAAVVLAAALAIGLYPHGQPAGQARPAGSSSPARSATGAAPARPAAAAPAVTVAGAQQILSAYLSRNNAANQVRSNSLLAAIEGGSSYAMDTGAYAWTRVTDPANSDYTPLTFTSPQFLIPQATGYPRWFAVRGTWAKTSGTTESGAYLVFARQAAAAPWLEVLEPNVIPGAPAIQAAAGPAGTAIAASPSAAAGLAQATASYLDTGTGTLSGFTAPGNLADLTDQAFWRQKLPAGSSDTDRHSPAAGPVFGLRTASGGVLEFYSLAATLTLTLPPGDKAGFQIPGYDSASDPVSSAVVRYADQFAVYLPPGGTARPQLVADIGGVVPRH